MFLWSGFSQSSSYSGSDCLFSLLCMPTTACLLMLLYMLHQKPPKKASLRMYSVLIFMFFFSLAPPPSGFPCGNHGHLRSSFAPAPLRLFRTSHAAASRPDSGGEVTNFEYICILFSSTAQGGGGSFKDRTL